MQTELRIQATVLPGHRLEVCDPQLPDGAKVDVTVVVPEQRIYLRQSMLEYVATLPPGPLLHRTVEDANRSLQKERDAWRGASHNRYEIGIQPTVKTLNCCKIDLPDPQVSDPARIKMAMRSPRWPS